MAKPKTEANTILTEADADQVALDDAVPVRITRPSRSPMPSLTVMRRAAEGAIRTVRKEEATARADERGARAASRPAVKKPLAPERIAKTVSVCCDWTITVPDATPSSEWLDSDFLRHLARQAHVGDRLLIRNDSFTRVVEAFVVLCEPAVEKIACRLWREGDLEPTSYGDQVYGGYTAHYGGLHDGWMVTRIVDSAVMFRGLPTRQEAIHRISNDLASRPVA